MLFRSGFRPGRAPRSLVGSRFKSELEEQIRSKLLADAMTQVSDTEKLSPISEPDLDVAAISLPSDGPMTFEFSIEVRPDFDLPEWKGLAIRRPTREISEADVDEALANVLRDRSRLVPHDGAAAAGDLIVANLRFLDGETVISEAREVEIVVRDRLSLADADSRANPESTARKKIPAASTTTPANGTGSAPVSHVNGCASLMSSGIMAPFRCLGLGKWFCLMELFLLSVGEDGSFEKLQPRLSVKRMAPGGLYRETMESSRQSFARVRQGGIRLKVGKRQFDVKSQAGPYGIRRQSVLEPAGEFAVRVPEGQAKPERLGR